MCIEMSPTRCGNAPGACDRTLLESGVAASSFDDAEVLASPIWNGGP
jgi:hypothetical protein